MKRWSINKGILKSIRQVLVALLIYGAIAFVLFTMVIGANIGKYYADKKFHQEQSARCEELVQLLKEGIEDVKSYPEISGVQVTILETNKNNESIYFTFTEEGIEYSYADEGKEKIYSVCAAMIIFVIWILLYYAVGEIRNRISKKTDQQKDVWCTSFCNIKHWQVLKIDIR